MDDTFYSIIYSSFYKDIITDKKLFERCISNTKYENTKKELTSSLNSNQIKLFNKLLLYRENFHIQFCQELIEYSFKFYKQLGKMSKDD